MTDSALLQSVRQDAEQMIQRMRTLVDKASHEDLRRAMGADSWSAIQILEHLTLSHEPYRTALSALELPDGDGPVRHTFLGKQIRKALGKSTGVPAPGKFRPSAQPDCALVITNWETCHTRLHELIGRLEGKRLSAGTIRNPIVPIFKQTAADVLAIYAAHLRYHLPQIEARLDMKGG